jgi:LuxR family maltose regulon positive regulatory protein
MLEALGLLERLLQAAEEGKRTGSVIEILVLEALAHQAQGDIPAALVPLSRALSLAEPEGYIRIFVDEGPPMVHLLEAAAKHGDPAWGAGRRAWEVFTPSPGRRSCPPDRVLTHAPNYVRQLLTATASAEDRPPVTQGLIEPMSERELEVLRLLGTAMSGRKLPANSWCPSTPSIPIPKTFTASSG